MMSKVNRTIGLDNAAHRLAIIGPSHMAIMAASWRPMSPSPTSMSPPTPLTTASSQPSVAISGKRLVPWLIAVAFFMESLDTTILNTAVPTIGAALHVAPLSMKSVLASYTLSLAVFIPISGWMADRFGTRRVFASAIGIFTLGSFLCGISRNIHVLVACRILQGCGGSMMVPVGRLTIVRTFAKSELIRAMSFVAIPALIGPMLGPIVGGLIVGYFHWSLIFFVNIPIGVAGLCMAYLHVPDYREHTNPLDVVGLILFGSGVALLSYVLEVFGEHTLNVRDVLGLLAVSIALLAGYGFHATKTAHPMLNLILFRIRTFRAAVSGSFLTRLGIGGIPFLFPLLYQVGLGFTPIQSGLLMMPQAIAAMSFKVTMPWILARLGYRAVLISNTLIIGLLILLFATIGPDTPVWMIVIEVFSYGFFTSLQYTSMNTLVYADVSQEQESGASSIASTTQQMAISFGVAAASLVAVFFIPDHVRSNPAQFIQGVHRAFFVLGGMTLVSTIVFFELKRGDGDAVSQRTDLHIA
jgi:EmrB/QacA subfamily drug resistance transporter